jgi:NAD(P)-dependent dehydrogenase (short-subunit alcohol dehydrogenase family)
MTELGGKVAVITGATNGIGVETALALARMGATVYVHGRSQDKIDATVAMVQEATGNHEVYGLRADLANLAAVRALAAEIRERVDRLDMLINNAGGVLMSEQLSADGYELQFAVNHLSHFLLTSLLLDLIRQTAAQHGEARIINLSSDAHKTGHIDWDTVGKSGKGFGAYSQSKLANVLFTYELARRLEGTGVAVNAVHPGLVATGFGRSGNSGLMNTVMSLLAPFSKTPAKGAETTVHVASAPELKGVTGKYFANSKAVPSNKASYNVAHQQRLWELSELMTDITSRPPADAQ